MKIEKLTDNKIRIIINLEELSDKKIDLNDFMINSLNSQKFFLDILNKAEKEIGFNTDNCKLLIESFSALDEIFVFTITKLSKPKKKKNTYKLKKNKTKIISKPVYKFSSFEEFCNLCEFIQKLNIPTIGIAKKISLFFYKNSYYLVLSDLNLSYMNFRKLFSILSEFSNIVKNSDDFVLKLFEYGKPIIKQNALKTGIKYFS